MYFIETYDRLHTKGNGDASSGVRRTLSDGSKNYLLVSISHTLNFIES